MFHLSSDIAHYRRALTSIINVLGPDVLCGCSSDNEDCGLRDEAADALTTAQRALGLRPSGYAAP